MFTQAGGKNQACVEAAISATIIGTKLHLMRYSDNSSDWLDDSPDKPVDYGLNFFIPPFTCWDFIAALHKIGTTFKTLA